VGQAKLDIRQSRLLIGPLAPADLQAIQGNAVDVHQPGNDDISIDAGEYSRK
jgi:hypothetical protein